MNMVPITTTKNVTNQDRPTVSFKLLTEAPKSMEIVLKKSIVPNVFGNEIIERCNYETCQLGKCLKNGTCECIYPAIGKFCDRIDECLILKCYNVS